MRLEGGQWVPTQKAVNPNTNEVVYFDGTEWVPAGPAHSGIPAAGQQKTSMAEDVLGYLNKGAQSFASGFTGGYMDNIAAGLDAVPVAAYRAIAEDKPFDIGQAYNDRLSAYRKDLGEFRRDNPVSSLGLEVAGGVTSPLAKLAAPLKVGGALLPRIGNAALGGGILGSIYGSGNADGDWSDLALGAAQGAGVGTVVGGAAVPAVDLVTGAVRKTVQSIFDRWGKADAGQRKAIQAIAKQYGGDIEKATKAVRQLVNEGDDLTFADVGGINAQRMARAAANVPGRGSQYADDFVVQRQAGRGNRLSAAADKLTPQNFHQTLDQLKVARSRAASPLYEKAFSPISDKAGRVYAQWDDRLQQFLDDPIVQKGMAKGIRIQQLEALAEGKPFNFKEYAVKGFDDSGGLIISGTPNLRAMDAAKRGMDDMLEVYRDKTTGKLVLDEMGRAINSVRKALVSKLDDISTNEQGVSYYKEARNAWAGPSQDIDAMWRGRRFMLGDEEITRKAFSAMSEAEKDAFQLGVRRQLSDMINKDTQTALGKFADKKADLWGRIESIFPKDRVEAFRKEIGVERQRFSTEQFVNPRAGSHTTPLAEDIAELQRVPSLLMETLEGASRGQTVSTKAANIAAALVRKPIEKLTAPSETTANSLARALLTLNRGEQEAFLNAFKDRRIASQLPGLTDETRRRLVEALTIGGAAKSNTQVSP